MAIGQAFRATCVIALLHYSVCAQPQAARVGHWGKAQVQVTQRSQTGLALQSVLD
jgi:hypothetical protein